MSTDPAPAWTSTSRLWLVLDQHACAPGSVLTISKLCIDGGVDAVLCRLRGLTGDQYLELARPVRQLCSARNVPFIVSHDQDLAAELRADAIQFGAADGDMQFLKEQKGQGTLFGYSAHSVNEAISAIAAGAAWVFLGPIFSTPEKLKYGQPLGLEPVKEILKSPKANQLVFIGGINAETLPELVATGASRIAAIAALQKSNEPRQAAHGLLAMLG